MRINNLYISRHRRLTDAAVKFEHTNSDDLPADVYGDLGITLLAGPNGSGKTSLLSLLVQIFHRLEREPDFLPAFEVNYSHQNVSGESFECTLKKDADFDYVSIRVSNGIEGIIRRNIRGMPVKNSGTIDYADILDFLPVNIIVSAFSLHGEYPHPRAGNWIGDRRIDVYDTKNIYGNNHYSFPSFSSSISRLLDLVASNDPAIEALENVIGGKFSGKVQVVDRYDRYYYDVEKPKPVWKKYTKAIQESEKNEIIYINDFELLIKGSSLTLGNMSSGQKMIFIRLLSILGKIQHGSVVIIEEPEIHLDLDWTNQLISILLAFFSTFRAHLLIATHAYSLLNAVPTNWILLAKDGQFKSPSKPTLLANESWISGVLFNSRPHAVEQRLLEFSAKANEEQLRKLLNLLGESSAKFAVFQDLQNLKHEKN